MRSFALRCAGVALFVLSVPIITTAEGVVTCTVIASEEASGIVTAEDPASGTTFEFRAPRGEIANLVVGTTIEADLDARVVIVGDRRLAMRKLQRAESARPKERATASATPRKSGETDVVEEAETQMRTTAETQRRLARKPERSVTRKTAQTSAPSGGTGRATRPASSASTLKTVPRGVTVQPKRPRDGGSAPPPKPTCYIGGCSGQVCSNLENVITTCEARPEYACYRSAQCMVQPDGQCGWTQTPDLQACLDNPPPP